MKLFVILAAMLITSFGFSQTQKQVIPLQTKSNQERYKIDYELKDYVFVNGDSTLLEEIFLNTIESNRLNSIDVEIFDILTNQTIILYSKEKVLSIKSQLMLLEH